MNRQDQTEERILEMKYKIKVILHTIKKGKIMNSRIESKDQT
jgi:hypothetical protein